MLIEYQNKQHGPPFQRTYRLVEEADVCTVNCENQSKLKGKSDFLKIENGISWAKVSK